MCVCMCVQRVCMCVRRVCMCVCVESLCVCVCVPAHVCREGSHTHSLSLSLSLSLSHTFTHSRIPVLPSYFTTGGGVGLKVVKEWAAGRQSS